MSTRRSPRGSLLVASAGLCIVAIVAAACGGSAKSAASPSADSTAPAAAAVTDAVSSNGTQLVVGGRYETQHGTIVCPAPEPLGRLVDLAQRGDAAGFTKALDDAKCSPVNAQATVYVIEQQASLARVRRDGDATVYWTYVDKLSPR